MNPLLYVIQERIDHYPPSIEINKPWVIEPNFQ